MEKATLETIKRLLLNEVDRTVWRKFRHSLHEVLNELYIRTVVVEPNPHGDEVFRLLSRAGILDTLTDPKTRALRDALQRLERGTFGLCLRCGQELPAEFLEKQPTARYCPACSGAGKKTDFSRLIAGLPMSRIVL